MWRASELHQQDLPGSVTGTAQREAPPQGADGDPLIGTVIGLRYRVDGLIGRGGMGTVYRAEHIELGTRVALKVLSRDGNLGADDVERFVREAKAAVRIRHPNIVRVFDLGRLEDGTPFMAMEELEGRDLDEMLVAGGTFALDETVSILEPIAAAIDAVHAEGLLHRDIKPANIFLARKEGRSVPILLDFGLAQLRDRTAEKRLTSTGMIVGTPHYLAPEVGLGKDPDERSDQYSLAVIAYEMLAGELPFDGTFATAIMIAKAQEDAPPARFGDTPAPPAVDAVLRRGLDRISPSRFASCTEMLTALRDAGREGARRTPRPLPTPASLSPTLPQEGRRGSPTSVPTLSGEMLALDPVTDARSPKGRLALVALVALLAATAGVFVWAPWGAPAADARSEADAPVEAPPDVAPLPVGPGAEEPAEVIAGAPVVGGSAEVEAVAVEPVTEPAPTARRPRSAMAPATAAPTEATPALVPAAGTAPREAAARMDAPADPPEVQQPERSIRDLMASAQSALLRGRLPDAAQQFREATYVSPRHAPAWRGLGVAEERLGHTPEARRAYGRYLQLAPNAGDASAIQQRLSALP